MSFKNWYENADMPEIVDGRWVDLETGIGYLDFIATQPARKLSQKALNAREVAKQFGGKALTGTPKQKEWAEKIRALVLNSVTQEQAEILCFCTKFNTAKFWIENRDTKAKDLAAKAEQFAALIKKANKINRESRLVSLSNVEACKAIIARHDAVLEEIEKLFK